MFNKIILIVLISTIFTDCTSLCNKRISKKSIIYKDSILDTVYIKPQSDNTDFTQTANKKSKNVSIKVVFANSYCGGVKPSQETLDEYKKEYPLVNSTILFQNVNDKTQSIKVTTDSMGIAIASLEAGVYNYFMTTSYSKTMGCAFNSTCDIWLKRPFGQVTIIKGETEGYKIAYNFGCNPCEPKRP